MTQTKIYVTLLILLVSALCPASGSNIFAGLVKRIEIPVGSGTGEVQWVDFVDNDWPVAVKGFNVTNDGELLFNETESGMVKIFDSSGVFQSSFSDHNTLGMFLADTILFGTRRWDEHSPTEIVALSVRSGRLVYEMPLGALFSGAFEMEDDKLYFRSLSEGREISFFDTKTRTLVNKGNDRQYEDEFFNTTCSKYDTLGFEKVGRIGQVLFFMAVDLHGGDKAGNPPCTYRLVAIRQGKTGEIVKEVTFKESEIGYWMPGERWPIVNNRYLYTIGYPRKGTKPGDKIWVTCIDLKKVFPQLFK
jgi:hypothetical protein